MCVPWTASVSDGTSTHTAEQKPAQTTSTAEDTHSSRGSAAIVGSEERLPAAPSRSQQLPVDPRLWQENRAPLTASSPVQQDACGEPGGESAGWEDAAERSRLLGWRFPRGVGPTARRQHHGQGRGRSQQQVAAAPSGHPCSLPWLEKKACAEPCLARAGGPALGKHARLG